MFLKTFVVRDHMNGFLIQQADNDCVSSKVLYFKNYLLLSAYKQELQLGFYPEEEDRDFDSKDIAMFQRAGEKWKMFCSKVKPQSNI